MENYYIDDSAKVERLEFEGTTIWSAHEFDEAQATAWVRGTNSDDTLDGTVNQGDVFDSNAGGDDILRGLSGDDIYWLGSGTGDDTIQEHYNNSGDNGDKVKIHTGIGTDNIRLSRSDNDDLVIQLLDNNGFGIRFPDGGELLHGCQWQDREHRICRWDGVVRERLHTGADKGRRR